MQHHRELVEVMPSRRIGGTGRREGGLKKGVVDSQVELSRVHTTTYLERHLGLLLMRAPAPPVRQNHQTRKGNGIR